MARTRPLKEAKPKRQRAKERARREKVEARTRSSRTCSMIVDPERNKYAISWSKKMSIAFYAKEEAVLFAPT